MPYTTTMEPLSDAQRAEVLRVWAETTATETTALRSLLTTQLGGQRRDLERTDHAHAAEHRAAGDAFALELRWLNTIGGAQ